MSRRIRRTGERVAAAVTVIYLAVALYVPLYLASQSCRGDLGRGSGFAALARNWLNCRLRAEHLDVGAYGNWLAGAVLIAVVYWAYRAFSVQADALEEQRRSVFLASIRQQHERFEALAQRIGDVLRTELKSYTPDIDAKYTYPVEATNALIGRLVRINDVELKAALRRMPFAEEYMAEGRNFILTLQRFDLPAYSAGSWRDLLNTLERLVPAGP